MAPPDHAPTPPATVTDGARVYETGRFLGKGGFAICHEATVQGQGDAEKVALKVVKTKMKTEVERRFILELRIHSKLQHRNICQLMRAFTDGPATYIVMELCSIGTMKELQHNRKTISTPELRFYMIKLASAVSYLHSRAVVHRDLKLGNIFIDRHMEPKIGDFGLASPLLTDQQEEIIRRSTLCGTPNYIAPEVLDKALGHGSATDIWCLACIMFVLYTNTLPFHRSGDKDHGQVFERAKALEYQWPDSQSIPLEARKLVGRALVKESDRILLDDFVEHPWFKAGNIPPRMDAALFTSAPKWLSRKEPKEMKAGVAQMTSTEMLQQCGFVPKSHLPNRKTSIFYDLVNEEKEMGTPSLPLTAVYEATVKPVPVEPVAKAAQHFDIFAGIPKEKTFVRPPAPAGPKKVREQLKLLLRNLNDALSCMPQRPTSIDDIPSPVLQWAQDTRSLGIGFIQANGTSACIFTSEVNVVPVAIAVPFVVEHYRSGASRHKVLPSSAAVEFYARDASGDLRGMPSDPATMRADGAELFKLWTRFTTYLAGKVPDEGQLEPIATGANGVNGAGAIDAQTGDFPIELQTIGNVHVWIWAAGATQWEFPDGKLQLSATGRWLRFWRPESTTKKEKAAAAGKERGTEAAAGGETVVDAVDLSVPTWCIFGSNGNEKLKEAAAEFDLEKKLGFVADVVTMWRAEGGWGASGAEKLVYGTGATKKTRKGDMEWTTIRI